MYDHWGLLYDWQRDINDCRVAFATVNYFDIRETRDLIILNQVAIDTYEGLDETLTITKRRHQFGFCA